MIKEKKGENYNKKKNKEYYWELATILPITNSKGKISNLLKLSKDITEKKRIEQELDNYRQHLEKLVDDRTMKLEEAQKELIVKEKFATLGKLTAVVSHEIRNPLATIRSSIYLIKEKVKDKELRIKKALNRVERNVKRCDQIIEELLDFSRTPILNLNPIPIDDWLLQIINDYPFSNSIDVNYTLNSGATVLIDEEHFRRVIINLIANACQAMMGENQTEEEQDKPEVVFMLEIKTQINNDKLIIKISDNGQGIPAETKQKIFEPLFSTKSFGVGLGLPIVQQIIIQHKGIIEIQSEVSKGTTVKVKLPLHEKL